MSSALSQPYPNPQQKLLLQASLLRENSALDAWKEWSASWVVDDYLDHGSFRLLPLLYRKLETLKVEDPRMSLLKGIYKQSWCKNLKLFGQSREVIQLLQEAAIPVMLLKGSALTLEYYHDSGVRPMADLDIMVPAEKAVMAVDRLLNQGWKAEFEHYIDYNLRYGRSMMFYNSEGFECDLHWAPFFEATSQGDDSTFWNHASEIDFLDLKVWTLSSEDQLLHTLVHGIRPNVEPPIRWVADAMMIVQQQHHPVHWERFADQVKRYKVTLQVRAPLQYLVEHFQAPVPLRTLEELSRARISIAEKLIRKYDTNNPGEVAETLWQKIHLLLIIFLRQSEKSNLLKLFPSFIKYLIFRTKGKNRVHIIRSHFKQNQLMKKSVELRFPESEKK